jgi:Methyltransferase domain
MFEGYRIVCVTPAGRSKYLRILVPQVLSSPIIDEYQLWLNTSDTNDIAYIHSLELLHERVRVVLGSTDVTNKTVFEGIPQFFVHAISEDSIYIRLDDDILYLELDFFENLLRFRVNNPQYFLVFPNIVNNAICTYIQYKRKAIDTNAPVYPWCMDRTGWWSARLAEQLHRAFLRDANNGHVAQWHFGTHVLAFTWFSINCMTWFGRDFALFGGHVIGNEEEYLTVLKPAELERTNCIFGDAVVAHYSFYIQRDYLDTTDIYNQYAALATLPAKDEVLHSATIGENIWTLRLLRAIETIQSIPMKDLRNVEIIADVIRVAGLTFDSRYLYGADNISMNVGSSGLWQLPNQLARCLVMLSNYKLDTVVECGTGSGWTTCILTAYLMRFNEGVRVVTIDPGGFFKDYPAVKHMLPIEYDSEGSSKDYRDYTFDLAFIDGDHSYSGCKLDYDSVGRKASICLFHDINDQYVASYESNSGGVPRLWSELREQVDSSCQVIEILDHSEGQQVMGIGMLIKARPMSLG